MELIRTLDEKQRLRLKAELSMDAEGKEDPTRMSRRQAGACLGAEPCQ
jgi:hypothetical protein